MKNFFLLIAIPFLIGGLSLAAPSLDQLQTLSETLLQTSQDKNKDLHRLNHLFTSCAEENQNAEIKQICKEFLENGFPLLEKKYTSTSWTWKVSDKLEKCLTLDVRDRTQEIEMDWGDGTLENLHMPYPAERHGNVRFCHTYAHTGMYTPSILNPEMLLSLTLLESNVVSFTLNKVDNLQKLYLGENPVKELKNGVFDGLNNLEVLYLGRSEISSIEPEVFSGLTSLKTLNLRMNQLTTGNPEWLKGLENLEYLSIAENKLSSLDPDTFSHLKNLQYIDIGGNPFGKLKLSHFNGLSYLTEEGDFPSFRS